MQIEQEIREFLMTRRARITPTQAGLPYVGGDRRVPGLRREEVAMLAGVSVEYYTRMERGKIGGASESVLDAIASVLQLDVDERAHLDDLARNVAPSPRRRPPVPASPISPSVQQVLDSMTVPAVVQNERLDILAANALGRALYTHLFDDQERPNFARFAFLDSRAAEFYTNLDDARDLCVAVLRATAGRDPLDQNTTELVGELSVRSGDFRQRWAKHNVHRHLRGRKIINHPVAGLLDVTYDDFALPGDPHISITTYTAEPGSTSTRNLTLLATWVDTQTPSLPTDTSAPLDDPDRDSFRPGRASRAGRHIRWAPSSRAPELPSSRASQSVDRTRCPRRRCASSVVRPATGSANASCGCVCNESSMSQR